MKGRENGGKGEEGVGMVAKRKGDEQRKRVILGREINYGDIINSRFFFRCLHFAALSITTP
jgi:hypothetical protein